MTMWWQFWKHEQEAPALDFEEMVADVRRTLERSKSRANRRLERRTEELDNIRDELDSAVASGDQRRVKALAGKQARREGTIERAEGILEFLDAQLDLIDDIEDHKDWMDIVMVSADALGRIPVLSKDAQGIFDKAQGEFIRVSQQLDSLRESAADNPLSEGNRDIAKRQNEIISEAMTRAQARAEAAGPIAESTQAKVRRLEAEE